jgi:phage terminase large subunit
MPAITCVVQQNFDVSSQLLVRRGEMRRWLHALRHYRYEVDEDLGTFSRKPLHDWAAHGADGFRYLAVAAKPKPRRMADAYARRRSVYRERGSWMAA